MKKPNLNRIIQLQQRNQQLKSLANNLANELIIDFDINDGYQMAYFLNVSQGLDNYTAIRIWAEKWLKTHYPMYGESNMLDDPRQDDTLYTCMKNQFFSCFPQTAIA